MQVKSTDFWQIKYKKELQELVGIETLNKFFKGQKNLVSWSCHALKKNDLPRTALERISYGKRPHCIPSKCGWME